jgi:hypothetical protein
MVAEVQAGLHTLNLVRIINFRVAPLSKPSLMEGGVDYADSIARKGSWFILSRSSGVAALSSGPQGLDLAAGSGGVK